MEAPPVQYARTADGHNIAYAVSGQGRPVIWMPHLFSHIQIYWSEQTFIRAWLEELAAEFQVVQYDGRGQGMSSRGLAKEHALEDCLRYLSAVVDRIGLDRFVLIAQGWSGHVSIRYAAANPARVEALVLQASPIRGEAYNSTIFEQLAGEDWDAFLRLISAQGLPADVAASVNRLKHTVTQEDHLALAHAWSASDIAGLLPALQTPALILHPRDFISMHVEEAMKLASALPNARMIVTDGATAPGDPVQGVKAIVEFLASLPPTAAPAAPAPEAPEGLSVREVEVLRLLAVGRSNAHIAETLVISPNTVGRHLSNIYNKIGASNRTEAAAFATRHGLI